MSDTNGKHDHRDGDDLVSPMEQLLEARHLRDEALRNELGPDWKQLPPDVQRKARNRVARRRARVETTPNEQNRATFLDRTDEPGAFLLGDDPHGLVFRERRSGKSVDLAAYLVADLAADADDGVEGLASRTFETDEDAVRATIEFLERDNEDDDE